ncbi:DUF1707 SHOCT-like domain-containing protein [Spirillospora sp. CA-294931]|uniref:DUF1707 SHOCT-like domain-containing protein n=1 Tax=Spirillospora sp. CA-294931 TaxID=3240042 RepID=UPI003D8F712C
MTRPDEIRVGDAEREALTSALHDHYAAGRLTRDELDERLNAALTSKTRGDLREIVRDLPGPSGIAELDPKGAHPYARNHHMDWGHRHHPAWGRGPRFPVFPLLVGLFFLVAFTAGAGAAFFTVLQVALLFWVVRAVFVAARLRRAR